MEYPEEYAQALQQTLMADTITQLLREPQRAPRFVYGALMLPTVLRYYLQLDPNADIHRRMTPATLAGYKLYTLSDDPSAPVIVRSNDPTASVQGMLIFALDNDQRNQVYEFEAGLMGLINVQVQIWQTDDRVNGHEVRSMRMVEAGAFAWPDSSPTVGLVPIQGSLWPVDDFLRGQFYRNIARSQRGLALEAERQR